MNQKRLWNHLSVSDRGSWHGNHHCPRTRASRSARQSRVRAWDTYYSKWRRRKYHKNWKKYLLFFKKTQIKSSGSKSTKSLHSSHKRIFIFCFLFSFSFFLFLSYLSVLYFSAFLNSISEIHVSKFTFKFLFKFLFKIPFWNSFFKFLP